MSSSKDAEGDSENQENGAFSMATVCASGNANYGVIGAGIQGEEHIVVGRAPSATLLAIEAVKSGEAVYL